MRKKIGSIKFSGVVKEIGFTSNFAKVEARIPASVVRTQISISKALLPFNTQKGYEVEFTVDVFTDLKPSTDTTAKGGDSQ